MSLTIPYKLKSLFIILYNWFLTIFCCFGFLFLLPFIILMAAFNFLVPLIVMAGFQIHLTIVHLIFSWQACIYFLIFAGSLLMISIYMWYTDSKLLERREMINLEKKSGFLEQLPYFSTIISVFGYCLGWLSIPRYIIITGDVLVILGFILLFLVFKENQFAATTINLFPKHKVIETGPYSMVRHPMYMSGLIRLLGTPLALGSLLGLIVVILYMRIIILRLLEEEEFLSTNLQGYNEYCQRIRYRLIPFLW